MPSSPKEDFMPNPKRLWLIIPGVVLFTLLLVAAGAFFGLEYYATGVLKKEIDQHIEDIADYVRVDYDSLGVNWLAFTVDLHQVRLRRPPLPGIITIDKVAVRDFTSIGIRFIPTVVTLDNIACTNDDFKITAGRLATSFSLSKIPTETEIDSDWRVLLDNLLAADVRLDKLTFAGQDTQLEVGKITTDYGLAGSDRRNFGVNLHNLKLQSGDVRLASQAFSLAASLDQNHVLNHFSKKITDLSFQFPPALARGNEFLEKLAALGYDRLALGLDLNYDYQPETKSLNLTWDTSAADLGRLQLDLRLGDFKSPPLPVNGSLVSLLNFLENLRAPAEKASLRGFKATYQDFGLAPRIIKAEAQALGQTSEVFTQNLVGSINGSLKFFPLPAALKEQVNSVNRFLLKPGEIQLAITCSQPVHLKSLQEGSLSGFLELLGNTEIKINAK
jgi:hypothetical protein